VWWVKHSLGGRGIEVFARTNKPRRGTGCLGYSAKKLTIQTFPPEPEKTTGTGRRKR